MFFARHTSLHEELDFLNARHHITAILEPSGVIAISLTHMVAYNGIALQRLLLSVFDVKSNANKQQFTWTTSDLCDEGFGGHVECTMLATI